MILTVSCTMPGTPSPGEMGPCLFWGSSALPSAGLLFALACSAAGAAVKDKSGPLGACGPQQKTPGAACFAVFSRVGPWQRQDSQHLGSSPSTVHTEGTWPRRLTQPLCKPRRVMAGLRQGAEPSPSSIGQRGHISPHQEHPFLISVPFCNWLICKCGSTCSLPPSSQAHTHLLLILDSGSQDSQSEAPEVVAQPPLPKLPLGRVGDRLPPPGLSCACAFPHPLSGPPALSQTEAPSPPLLLLDPLFLPPDLRE